MEVAVTVTVVEAEWIWLSTAVNESVVSVTKARRREATRANFRTCQSAQALTDISASRQLSRESWKIRNKNGAYSGPILSLFLTRIAKNVWSSLT